MIFFPLSLSAQELRGLGYKKGKPLGLVGVTELSEDQKKQLKEQQEVWRAIRVEQHMYALGVDTVSECNCM